MTTRKKTKKPARMVRSEEYKKDAVKLADTVGVTKLPSSWVFTLPRSTIGVTSCESRRLAVRLKRDCWMRTHA